MNNRIKAGIPAILAIVSLAFPFSAIQAVEIDFSCIEYRVWGKSHLSDRYREFDIVLENRCPGPANWTMCIERMDPWTNKVLETHTPSGHILPEKKARVNLQLKRASKDRVFHNRFQEFYVNFGYSINDAPSVECYARQCEEKKKDIRGQIRANEKAWKQTDHKINSQIAEECPDSGWDKTTREECEREIREAQRVQMELYVENDVLLREQITTIDPLHCQVWSGELTDP